MTLQEEPLLRDIPEEDGGALNFALVDWLRERRALRAGESVAS